MAPQAIEQKVLTLALQGMGATEISSAGMKSREQVTRILRKLKADGKLTVTPTGRIEQSPTMEAAKSWRQLSRDEFVNEFEPVRSWIMYKRGQVKSANHLLNNLKVICDTLKINPSQRQSRDPPTGILGVAKLAVTGPDSLDALMGTFKAEFSKTHTLRAGGWRHYIYGVVSFVSFNGVSIPERLGGNLSREKSNYGAYSNIKLTDKQRDQMISYALGHFHTGLSLAVAVGSEALTPRSFTFRNITADRVKFVRRWGFETAEFDVYESKTGETYPKVVIDPRVVKLLRDAIKTKTGFLFGNGQDLDESELSVALRECYAQLGIDVVSDGNGSLINYWKKKPIHALRHSTTDLWLRRLALNASLVKIMGWKIEEMITAVYSKLSKDYLFGQGRCDYCKPEEGIADEENHFYCSMKCAVLGLNEKYGNTTFGGVAT